jgi:hypothetical protein
MDSRERDERAANAGFVALAENYDPSDDSEFEPDPDDVNDEVWDLEDEEEADDEDDDDEDED